MHKSLFDRIKSLLRGIVEQDLASYGRGIVLESVGIDLGTGHAVGGQRQREIHAGEKRGGVDPLGIRARIPGRFDFAVQRLA